MMSRITETIYILTFVNVFFKEMEETTIPVRIIAIGDMQLPATSTREVIHSGNGRPINPMIIPIGIEIKIGFTKFLRDSLKVCFFSESAMSNLGTPQIYISIHNGRVKIRYSKKTLGNRLLIIAFPMNPKLENAKPYV